MAGTLPRLRARLKTWRFQTETLPVTAALEKEPGALYDWMRDVWRGDFDVAAYTLQEAIIPKDEAMFESYWIDQFATLLNVTGNRAGKTDSQTARQIIAAIKAQLDQAKQPLP